MKTDKGNLSGMILSDLQEAFDTVAHSILRMKLSAADLGDAILKWLKLYGRDKQQLVDISGNHAGKNSMSYEVTLLFFIYINDMSVAIKSRLLLNTDDRAAIACLKYLFLGKDVTFCACLLL